MTELACGKEYLDQKGEWCDHIHCPRMGECMGIVENRVFNVFNQKNPTKIDISSLQPITQQELIEELEYA